MVKYLIERTDTNEWYFPSLKGTIYGSDYVKKAICHWTNDANWAMQFNTEHEAREAMRLDEDIPDSIRVDCIVTEHEFVNTVIN